MNLQVTETLNRRRSGKSYCLDMLAIALINQGKTVLRVSLNNGKMESTPLNKESLFYRKWLQASKEAENRRNRKTYINE